MNTVNMLSMREGEIFFFLLENITSLKCSFKFTPNNQGTRQWAQSRKVYFDQLHADTILAETAVKIFSFIRKKRLYINFF